MNDQQRLCMHHFHENSHQETVCLYCDVPVAEYNDRMIEDLKNRKMADWDVFSNSNFIDRVSYTEDCDAEEVRKSLINHDHYDPWIKVEKSKVVK